MEIEDTDTGWTNIESTVSIPEEKVLSHDGKVAIQYVKRQCDWIDTDGISDHVVVTTGLHLVGKSIPMYHCLRCFTTYVYAGDNINSLAFIQRKPERPKQKNTVTKNELYTLLRKAVRSGDMTQSEANELIANMRAPKGVQNDG